MAPRSLYKWLELACATQHLNYCVLAQKCWTHASRFQNICFLMVGNTWKSDTESMQGVYCNVIWTCRSAGSLTYKSCTWEISSAATYPNLPRIGPFAPTSYRRPSKKGENNDPKWRHLQIWSWAHFCSTSSWSREVKLRRPLKVSCFGR